AQRLRDTAGNLLLNGEDVLELPVVTLGPHGTPAGSFYQLRGDAHAVAGAPDRAFQNVGGAELLADLLHRCRFVPKGEHFRAWKDFELRDFRELRDDVLGDSIAEILIFFRAALIFKVQHGN